MDRNVPAVEVAPPITDGVSPTGAPCPRTVRLDGTIEGSGACFACGTCLLFGGLLDVPG